MRNLKWTLALVLAFGLALGSLATAQRMGAWPDVVVANQEPNVDQAVLQLEVGVFDVYAFQVTNPDVKQRVEGSLELDYVESAGSYSELTFNPVGPEFPDGNLNPFAVPRIREAMNMLIDRNFVAQEIYGGLAVPRWHPFNTTAADYARYIEVARAIELAYAHNPAAAEAIITEEMEKLGASKVGGVWNYNGAPVVLKVLIRNEDERLALGDYVANVLEDIGFQTERLYRNAAEASPLWISGPPEAGAFHVYTGGWITTVIPRDLGGNFAFFYTDTGLGFPLWQAYVNEPEFYDLAQALDNNEFTTLAQRDEMIARALQLAIEDSVRIWVVDRLSITPKRQDISVAADLFGGVSGAWLWPYTLRRGDEVGGRIDVAMPSMLPEPWNPLDGSNWIYDMMLVRATGENAIMPDPYTGLNLPHRIERAVVTVQEDLPVGKTYDWVDLETAPEIVVPTDAWSDWDAANQRWITVGERFPEGVTALRKITTYYPADLYDTVKWHDGSAFSAADIVMAMILGFDRGNEDSFVYDESKAPALRSFLSAFRGVKIISVDPLVIETYTDVWYLDAETAVSTWWPYYAQGQGSWHALALGLFAESEEALAFTSAKSEALEVEWTSFISGPAIATLDNYLERAIASDYLPYASVLSAYVGDGEIAERYANLAAWRASKGHYWVGTGPFYLERAFPIESVAQLNRNPDYPDPADKWAIFAEPRIPVVELDGPTRVVIGADASFEVFVSFRDEAYPADDILQVKYLLFDGTGTLVESGDAALVAAGVYEVGLGADLTSSLDVGSNRLEVAVVSRVVALPSFDSVEFVTTR